MGIDVDACLIYGIPYAELPEDILEEVDEMLDNGALNYASPYYDAPRDEWIVGNICELWGDDLQNAERELFVAASKIPAVLHAEKLGFYISPHVT